MTFALVVSATAVLATMPVMSGRIVLRAVLIGAQGQDATIVKFAHLNSARNGAIEVCD